ncbi:MAG: hypothetical protein HOW73_48540, partial [Polyangiaceae bacterium]|nr:hypothetical protein [Polyangiaceae bacterium]
PPAFAVAVGGAEAVGSVVWVGSAVCSEVSPVVSAVGVELDEFDAQATAKSDRTTAGTTLSSAGI